MPVIAYDRLIEDPKALYITFDNAKVGELQAQAIFDLAPKGNDVIIKGNKADANADFLPAAWTRRSKGTQSTRATSRSSKRPTPTTGIPP